MNLSDVKVGMKVVPFRKSVGVMGEGIFNEDNYVSDYLYKANTPCSINIKAYGYGIVRRIEDDGVIVVDDGGNSGGDYFYASDLNEYKEKETPMEKKMTKADLKGSWVKCIKGGLGHKSTSNPQSSYKTGELYKIDNSGGIGFNGSWYFCDWSTLLPNEFTINELNKSLQTNCGDVQFIYIGDNPQTQNKVEADEVKSDKKSKVSEIKTKLHVDLLFDKPVVEETNDEVFIFAGRSTIYISKEFGVYGVATVNSNELKSYDREVGRALSYFRAYKSMDKK